MANCNCKSRCFTSSGIANLNPDCDVCLDVCTTPICGTPDALLLYAPVVYDCIGINLCRQVPLGVVLPTTYPTAAYATAEVIDLTATTATITPITNRPNCYNVELSGLTFTVIIRLFDCCQRLLATLPLTDVTYLPAATTDPNYNEDTNPTDVTLQLYAPYGPAYTVTPAGGTDPATAVPTLIFNGQTVARSPQTQGIQSVAVAKVLNLDATDSTISLGLTLYVYSIYDSFYNFYGATRGSIPKGNLSTVEESVCMNFVRGSLLDRNIKPLELGSPGCEGLLKNDCSTDLESCDSATTDNTCGCGCAQS